MTFIYVFLPIVCSLYLFVKNELRNYVLLISSLVFYAWGGIEYLAIMLVTIIINYIGAIIIEHFDKPRKKLLALLGVVASNLLILGYFKYYNFLLENINLLFKSNIDFVKVALPIGISFYIFQSISYLVDVYRGDVKAQRDLYKLALYISLFPQLIAGPIVKYHDINEQIDNRNVTIENVLYGIKRFIIGLAKKVLLANTFGEIADKVFAQNADSFSPGVAWLGAIAYTLQIFFDFSGYSDMAIGLGRIFGFTFKENFNYPYISKSITEFWRRWHISLSTWFKEYLYIPLGGNRKGNVRTYINLFFVFIMTGVWHGATWSFVVWGIYNGIFIVAERFFGLNKDKPDATWYYRGLMHIYCILAFIIGWVLFRAPDLQYALTYIGNMFGITDQDSDTYKLIYYIDVIPIVSFIIALICCVPLFNNWLVKSNDSKAGIWIYNFYLLVLFLFSTASIASSTYNPFIYFRF